MFEHATPRATTHLAGVIWIEADGDPMVETLMEGFPPELLFRAVERLLRGPVLSGTNAHGMGEGGPSSGRKLTDDEREALMNLERVIAEETVEATDRVSRRVNKNWN